MDRSARGRHEYAGLIGGDPEQAQTELRSRSPYLYDSLVEGAFGGPLARPELSRVHREIATLAMIAAIGGAEPQLAAHTRAALRQGIAPEEILALAEHVSLYAGFPRALNALTVFDNVLAEAGLPRPIPLRRVRATDHETVVAHLGESGPPVVLIHAMSTDWRMWEAVMRPLAEGRRVFAYDVRGHGWAAGSRRPHTMADVADDLVAVLDALELETAHVVGLSYGGGIAQTAAVAHPDRFESLTLAATTDTPFREIFESRARSGEVDGMAAQVVPTLLRWFTPESLAADISGVRYARERVLRMAADDWAAGWRYYCGLDVQGRLADFGKPTLVLCGEKDLSCGPEVMTAMAGRIPGSEYRELPGLAHMLALERPDLVVATLDGFLPVG